MIIALTGPAGCGKDTTALILQEQYSFSVVSFSAELYRQVADAYGVDESFLRNRKTKEIPSDVMAPKNCKDKNFVDVLRNIREKNQNGSMDNMLGVIPEEFGSSLDNFEYYFQTGQYSPRQILQYWGTEYKRYDNDNYWVNFVKEWMDKEKEKYALEGKEKHFVITDLRFDNEEVFLRKESAFIVVVDRMVQSVAKHQSELFWKKCKPDYVLDNTGTVGQLRENVDKLMQFVSHGMAMTTALQNGN